jgi:hypothetical protein
VKENSFYINTASFRPFPVAGPTSHQIFFRAMGRVSGDVRQIAFWLAIVFVILGAILLAVALYDTTTTADHTAMGCIGITFTALAISLVAFLTYD